jgi:signal transduction histidine kinase/ActR/RegA family two-component response regulator
MRRPRSLRLQLVATFVAVALVPPVLFGGVALRLTLERVRTDAALRNRQIALSIAGEIGRYLEMQLGDLHEIGLSVAALEAERRSAPGVAEVAALLALHTAANPVLRTTLLVDHAGRVVHASPPDPDLPGNDVAAYPFVRRARETGAATWSEITIAPGTARPSVALAVPEGRWLIVSYLDLAALGEIVERTHVGDGGDVTVLDAHGTLIAHRDARLVREQVNAADSPALRDALAGRDGTRELRFLGQDVLASTTRVPATGWVILTAEPLARAYEPYLRLRKALLVALGTAAVLALVAGALSLRGVLHGLDALQVVARRIAGGDYTRAAAPAVEGGHRELRELAVDIDAMVEAVRSREEALARAQRLEAIGQLAGGVAHDFNNLLTVVVSDANFLAEEAATDDQREAAASILATAGRAAQLTRGLLAYSRRNVLQPRPTALEDVVRGVERMIRRVIGEDVAVEVSLPAEPLVAVADPGQLEQVLLNLCTNARDAMPRGGRLALAADRVELTAAAAAAAGFTAGGTFARLRVADTGEGIPAEDLGRIFEPFFTTKSPGKGTGLGLAVVYGIVRQHGGQVTVESRPGEGTTFSVLLRLASASAVAAAPEAVAVPAGAATGGDETILVAEDEPRVREVLRRTLARAGYRVIEAVDGSDAVRQFEAHRSEIALSLVDVIMPGLNGREVSEAIRARAPDARILLASGYTADILESRGLGKGVEVLAKPFVSTDLLVRVRAALDGGREERSAG